MKLKLRKKIDICGYKFKVKYDKNDEGGSFDFAEQVIWIGTEKIKKDPEHVLSVIMHELSEAIHVGLSTRFYSYDGDEDYMFVTNHKQFTTHNELLTKALSKFIK